MLQAEGPNARQIAYWNEISGPKWVELDEAINRLIAPLGSELLDTARVESGERVLDVGCGCGVTTLALAQRVGPGGRVTGIDISTPMLESAALRCDDAGAEQVEFLNADAQTRDFSQMEADLVFSRFGVMFFAQPEAAFRNLRSALRPGGRLHFACWRERRRNPWMILPAQAVAELVEPPVQDPDAPGPYALADPEKTQAILRKAGFSEVACESLDRTIDVTGGRSLDETVAFLAQMGPAGALLREASDEVRQTARQAIRDRLEPLLHEGRIELGASVWLVSALLG